MGLKGSWLRWRDGLPTRPGLYWLCLQVGKHRDRRTFVVEAYSFNGKLQVGPVNGGMPLEMVYSPKLVTAWHLPVRPWRDSLGWKEQTYAPKSYSWVLEDGHHAFGKLRYGSLDSMVFVDRPGHSWWHGNIDRRGHLFQQVEEPDLP